MGSDVDPSPMWPEVHTNVSHVLRSCQVKLMLTNQG